MSYTAPAAMMVCAVQNAQSTSAAGPALSAGWIVPMDDVLPAPRLPAAAHAGPAER